MVVLNLLRKFTISERSSDSSGSHVRHSGGSSNTTGRATYLNVDHLIGRQVAIIGCGGRIRRSGCGVGAGGGAVDGRGNHGCGGTGGGAIMSRRVGGSRMALSRTNLLHRAEEARVRIRLITWMRSEISV